ncbi:MmgE/PrpD family protein [Actinoallomurus sp. NBC_01490]|uniref:MmgE/PrpD family protein n=1 Tax=Actinoallomurus sp. NBC_01490 TaxID=2903557 RepID=UPI002E2F4424|nr:MmgE/PrpD family protein [Actinoallomurus sp. NBC_01490]
MSGPLLDDLVEAARGLAERGPSADVRRHAALLAADTLGVMLAGGRRPEAVALVSGDPLTGPWARAEPGSGPAARFMTAGGGWGAPDRAAYVNATATCALELDEGMRPTGHPAAHVLPAALAAAEALDRDWDELLTAFVAGYEVAAGLFAGIRLRPPTHPHGHLGAAGAAVAVALLAGDDPLPAARAATTIPLLTTWAPCLEGANVRNSWAGHAAAAGLLARRLVHAGYRGAGTALETAFDGLAGDRTEVDPGEVGTRITGGYIKLYSACAITHSAVEAALALAPVSATSVASVHVTVNANSMKTAAQPAGNDLSRRFSIPYAVAVALLRGDADPARFDRPDAEALELATKVTVAEDPEATAAWPEYAPATVRLTPAEGPVRTAHVDDALGHPGNPVGPDAVRNKFLRLSGRPAEVWDLLTGGYSSRKVRHVLDAVTRT